MNVLLNIVSIGIITVALSMAVRSVSKDFALIVSLTGGIVILFYVFPVLKNSIEQLSSIAGKSGIGNGYIVMTIRIIALAYITEFGVGIAKDAGETSLASKIELGGKIVIFSVCIPTLVAVVDTVIQLMT